MTSTLDQLLSRARELAQPGTRRILGIAGAPGAGKSTLAQHLADGLGSLAVIVPMDGFHLANVQLRQLGRADRKGAPDTFDAHGYAGLLRRLRNPEPGVTVYAPTFERELEEPVAGSIAVPADVPLVITEGNYLLLGDGPWAQVRPLLDAAWFIDLDAGVRIGRLVDRHIQFGKEPAEATEWVHRSDETNAQLVTATSGAADLVVRL